MSSQDYKYEPLQSSDYIRLVELFPTSKDSDTLCCRIFHTELARSLIPYNAISYVWGAHEAKEAKTIQCTGLSISVLPNLHSALRRLSRLSNESQVIWVDALCIDQSADAENSEKAQQVQMMDRIFAGAANVVVDLGDLSDGDKHVLWALDQVRHTAAAAAAANGAPKGADGSKRLSMVGSDPKFWLDLARFLNRPWFSRIWVLQEYALAQNVQFLIGRHMRDEHFLRESVLCAAQHFNAAHVQRSLDVSDGHDQVVSSISRQYQAITRIYEVRYAEKFGRSLCELLDATTVFFQSTKVEDKVYGMLGLLSDTSVEPEVRDMLYVDYREPLPAFAMRMSRYLWKTDWGVYPLYHCVGDRPGYVSWALELQQSESAFSNLVHPRGYVKNNLFHCCGSQPFVSQPSALRRDGLVVRGCLLDTIGAIMPSPVVEPGSATQPSDPAWFSNIVMWMLALPPDLQVPADHFRQQIFRTAVAGLVTIPGGTTEAVRLRTWNHCSECLEALIEEPPEVIEPPWVCDRSYCVYRRDRTSLSDKVADARTYRRSLAIAKGRRIAISKRGRFSCLVPDGARVGDRIVIVQGGPLPLIMRTAEDEHGLFFRIVGGAYVDGVMDGQVFDPLSKTLLLGDKRQVYRSGIEEMRDLDIC